MSPWLGARCAGVLREEQNSPNRESDDRLIMEAVLAAMAGMGVETSLLTPEEFDASDPADLDLLVPMCESYPRLKRLSSLWRARASQGAGPMLINPPEAVLNCYRTRMAPILSRYPSIGFPPSEVRAVAEGPGPQPAWPAPEGWWVKRGDVHNTCDRDVVRARAWTGLGTILDDFRSREVTHYLVQPHVPGDLVKFYGVGPGLWFTWFYHDPAAARRHPFETASLAGMVGAASAAVGLEVFGGDAIISPGRISVIDINSWPSFARVRREAASHIAAHLRSRLRSEAARDGRPHGGAARRLP